MEQLCDTSLFDKHAIHFSQVEFVLSNFMHCIRPNVGISSSTDLKP